MLLASFINLAHPCISPTWFDLCFPRINSLFLVSVLCRGCASQGMWLATREQLRRLSKKQSCRYLDFDESSGKGHVETHSGSIQMFRPNCGLQKVWYCGSPGLSHLPCVYTSFALGRIQSCYSDLGADSGRATPGLFMVHLRSERGANARADLEA